MKDALSEMLLVPPNDPVLRIRAIAVEDIAAQVAPHIEKMKDLMEKHQGVGLAAPQVGIPLRFFISKIAKHDVVINPKIVSVYGGRVSKVEGCLTFPNRVAFVARMRYLIAQWTDINGVSQTSTLDDFDARIFQHEIDHLDGICIFS